MRAIKHARLFLRALYELGRYELIVWLCGSARILQQLRRQYSGNKHNSAQPNADKTGSRELEQTICNAVLVATCFYWKPVLCLQRAVCTVRLLRRHGIIARLVIGYRPSPFFSHAWVEVDERVVYGSPVYKQRLTPLHVA